VRFREKSSARSVRDGILGSADRRVKQTASALLDPRVRGALQWHGRLILLVRGADGLAMSYENPYRSSYAPKAPAERKESGLGIASFLIGLVAGAMELVLIAIAAVMATSSPGGMDEKSPQAIVLGLGILAGLALAILGLLTGIVAMLDRRRAKVFAILGVLCSGMVLLCVALLLIVGTAMG
jgi:hypothetical protein